MITLHVEAPTVKELMAKALVALGALEAKPAMAAARDVPQGESWAFPEHRTMAEVDAAPAVDAVVEPPKKNKGGRKKQTPEITPEQTAAVGMAAVEAEAAQPAVASNTGSDQAGTSPPADGAVTEAGADTQEISQPASDVTPEQLHAALNEVAALDSGHGIRHVVTMLDKVGGYRKVREITDQIHRNRLMAVVNEALANKDDFVANPGIYMAKLAA